MMDYVISQVSYFEVFLCRCKIFIATFLLGLFLKDPSETNLLYTDMKPNQEFLLGTDDLGRDVLSRLIHGTFTSLWIASAVIILQTIIGTLLGCISGYFLGVIDMIIYKFSELIRCFPFFVLAIVLSVFFGGGALGIIVILSVIGWTGLYVVVRAETLRVRSQEYIVAANALGLSNLRIITGYIIPNILPTVATMMCINASSVIISESSLSFLGIGITPPTATLGSILSNARNLSVLTRYWWQWIPAGITIIVLLQLVNSLTYEKEN